MENQLLKMAVSLILCINYQHKQPSHLSILTQFSRFQPWPIFSSQAPACIWYRLPWCELYALFFGNCDAIPSQVLRLWKDRFALKEMNMCTVCIAVCIPPACASFFCPRRLQPVLMQMRMHLVRLACTRLFRVMHAGRGLGIYTVHSLKEEMGVEAIYSRCRALHSNRVFCLTSSSSTAALLCSLQQQQQQLQQLA